VRAILARLYDPAKRSVGNTIAAKLKDGTELPAITIEYPIGHKRRREEAYCRLIEKFHRNGRAVSPEATALEIESVILDRGRLEALAVDQLMNLIQA
jgi:2-methylcitrate dehydratase